STHDTKRGEDTRARLAALSEFPEDWGHQVEVWSRLLRARRADLDRSGPPDRNDEYLFYQILLGSWPAELMPAGPLEGAKFQRYAEGLKEAMRKSIREAKVHSTWACPNLTYENAMMSFVEDALDPQRSCAFLTSFRGFQERLAEIGVSNSLAQLVLK